MDKLLSFLHGRLSPEESLKIIELAERDPAVSREIELAIELGQAVEEVQKMWRGRKSSEPKGPAK